MARPKLNTLTTKQREFVVSVQSKFGGKVTRKQVLDVAKESNLPTPFWFVGARFKNYLVARGTYDLDKVLQDKALKA